VYPWNDISAGSWIGAGTVLHWQCYYVWPAPLLHIYTELIKFGFSVVLHVLPVFIEWYKQITLYIRKESNFWLFCDIRPIVSFDSMQLLHQMLYVLSLLCVCYYPQLTLHCIRSVGMIFIVYCTLFGIVMFIYRFYGTSLKPDERSIFTGGHPVVVISWPY
jgi:hypothetical protein